MLPAFFQIVTPKHGGDGPFPFGSHSPLLTAPSGEQHAVSGGVLPGGGELLDARDGEVAFWFNEGPIVYGVRVPYSLYGQGVLVLSDGSLT